MIEKGYILLARCIQDSAVAHCPPYVREIWLYLLLNANHRDLKYDGHVVKRGQLFRTYSEIRDALHWKIGYRKMTYNENHTKKAMKILREYLMIDTTKELGGVLITVLNYDKYQDFKNYESTNERTNERTNAKPMRNHPVPTITKNVKNEMNVKNETIVSEGLTPFQEAESFFSDPEKQEACIQLLKEKGLPEDSARTEIGKFSRYWTEPTANGKRLRWQTEKTFEIKRRLITWLGNIQKINSRASPQRVTSYTD